MTTRRDIEVLRYLAQHGEQTRYALTDHFFYDTQKILLQLKKQGLVTPRKDYGKRWGFRGYRTFYAISPEGIKYLGAHK